MATAGSSHQQDETNSYSNHFDIMLIGRTGRGKSTTADKLLMANPRGKIYSSEGRQNKDLHNMQSSGSLGDIKILPRLHQYSCDSPKSSCEDISMWHVTENDDDLQMVRKRLKSLVTCRQAEYPYKVLNEIRKDSASSQDFELLSNDTSLVRVLDVPGFFSPDLNITDTDKDFTKSLLQLMRKIIHIKQIYHFKFNRIVYFLPVQGVLNRPDQILQTELKIMETYFGDSIFQCMVVVATRDKSLYDVIPEGTNLYKEEHFEATRSIFKDAMQLALDKEDVLQPPVIFLSFLETCDNVLDLIKNAEIIKEGIELALVSTTCVSCNLTFREVVKGFSKTDRRLEAGKDGEKIIMCTNLALNIEVPYTESTCHPKVIPKYTMVERIAGGIAHVFTMQLFGDIWPNFKSFEEVCISCRQSPGDGGCKQVGTIYHKRCRNCQACKNCKPCREHCEKTDFCSNCFICETCRICQNCEEIKVDHTNEVTLN